MTFTDWLGVYVLLGIAWAIRVFFTMGRHLKDVTSGESFVLPASDEKDAEEIQESIAEIRDEIDDASRTHPTTMKVIIFVALVFTSLWDGVVWPYSLVVLLCSRKSVTIPKRK